MTRILKSLGLALMAMTAMTAVAAADASAQTIDLTTFNTSNSTMETAKLKVGIINPSVYTVVAGGVPITCVSETYTGTTSGADSAPRVAPTYKECHAVIGGSKVGAEIHTNGCEYQFTAETEVSVDEFTGSAKLVNCKNEDKSITITTNTGCVVHVREASNQKINGVTYINKTAASPHRR